MDFREAEIAAQTGRDATVLDAFMRVYLDHLTPEWRRGRIANYRKQDRNRTFLKGKLYYCPQLDQGNMNP